ncbi:BEM_collapsed_G0058120.mRNA.1.CDS.1 [Saccharomyces cerevisiae]|nr:BEM_collapsed_G0058120.mRNA.1.CDS.1 [Saccharomyces cerevisiae]
MNPKSSTPKIPRPKNAFILFRQHYHRILIDEWTAQGVEYPIIQTFLKLLVRSGRAYNRKIRHTGKI